MTNALAWFVLAFAIFNSYMLVWASRVSLAVFLVFATLEITEILLVIGFFTISQGGSEYILHLGGWMGVVTAALSWYTLAAGVVNGMTTEPVLPVSDPRWGTLPAALRRGSPTSRRGEV